MPLFYPNRPLASRQYPMQFWLERKDWFVFRDGRYPVWLPQCKCGRFLTNDPGGGRFDATGHVFVQRPAPEWGWERVDPIDEAEAWSFALQFYGDCPTGSCAFSTEVSAPFRQLYEEADLHVSSVFCIKNRHSSKIGENRLSNSEFVERTQTRCPEEVRFQPVGPHNWRCPYHELQGSAVCVYDYLIKTALKDCSFNHEHWRTLVAALREAGYPGYPAIKRGHVRPSPKAGDILNLEPGHEANYRADSFIPQIYLNDWEWSVFKKHRPVFIRDLTSRRIDFGVRGRTGTAANDADLAQKLGAPSALPKSDHDRPGAAQAFSAGEVSESGSSDFGGVAFNLAGVQSPTGPAGPYSLMGTTYPSRPQQYENAGRPKEQLFAPWALSAVPGPGGSFDGSFEQPEAATALRGQISRGALGSPVPSVAPTLGASEDGAWTTVPGQLMDGLREYTAPPAQFNSGNVGHEAAHAHFIPSDHGRQLYAGMDGQINSGNAGFGAAHAPFSQISEGPQVYPNLSGQPKGGDSVLAVAPSSQSEQAFGPYLTQDGQYFVMLDGKAVPLALPVQPHRGVYGPSEPSNRIGGFGPAVSSPPSLYLPSGSGSTNNQFHRLGNLVSKENRGFSENAKKSDHPKGSSASTRKAEASSRADPYRQPRAILNVNDEAVLRILLDHLPRADLWRENNDSTPRIDLSVDQPPKMDGLYIEGSLSEVGAAANANAAGNRHSADQVPSDTALEFIVEQLREIYCGETFSNQRLMIGDAIIEAGHCFIDVFIGDSSAVNEELSWPDERAWHDHYARLLRWWRSAVTASGDDKNRSVMANDLHKIVVDAIRMISALIAEQQVAILEQWRSNFARIVTLSLRPQLADYSHPESVLPAMLPLYLCILILASRFTPEQRAIPLGTIIAISRARNITGMRALAAGVVIALNDFEQLFEQGIASEAFEEFAALLRGG